MSGSEPDPGSSLVSDKGYYEECLYGNLNSDNLCSRTCGPDMIVLQPTTTSKQIMCHRCPTGSGILSNDTTTCRKCSELNKIHHPRGYGCEDCPDGKLFDKSTGDCRVCNNIVTLCENNGGSQCPNPSYSFTPDDEFYETCLQDDEHGDIKCSVNQHCMGNLDNSIPVAAPTTNPADNPVLSYNLYMNEVCRTITDDDDCGNVTGCKWSTDFSPARCLLNLPEHASIRIPLAIPANMSSPSNFNKQNAFPTPSSNKSNYTCQGKVVGTTAGQTEELKTSDFWTTPYHLIYEPETTCNGIENDIRIDNIYTGQPVNVYASSIPGQPCQHYGCVPEDRYYEVSIPKRKYIGPLCQELMHAHSYYNKYNLSLPESINGLIVDPSKYGCNLYASSAG